MERYGEIMVPATRSMFHTSPYRRVVMQLVCGGGQRVCDQSRHLQAQVQGRSPLDDTHCIAQPGAKRNLGRADISRIGRSQHCYPIVDAFPWQDWMQNAMGQVKSTQ